MNTIVINFLAEPGAGKSTAAMAVTAELKRQGVNAEYVSEFTKDKVYENNNEVFKHQEYIFGKQSFKMGRVRNKVEVIVTDSPLLLSIIYNHNEILGRSFDETVLNVFNSYDNRNYLVKRNHAYECEGRLQDEAESRWIREHIIRVLINLDIPYETITSNNEDCKRIATQVAQEVRARKEACRVE